MTVRNWIQWKYEIYHMELSLQIQLAGFAHLKNFYTVGHKKGHFTFVNIFNNYWPVFKIFLLALSADSSQ